MSQEQFDEFMGVVWVQPDGPNTAPQPLLCVDVDTVDEPQGDVTIRLCRQGDRGWKTVLSSQATPGQVSFDVVADKTTQRSWLQKQVERRCPMPFYFHHNTCGRLDTFNNYEAGKVVQWGTITSKSNGNMVRGRADEGDSPERTSQTFSVAAGPPSPEYYKQLETVQDPASEDEPLRDIIHSGVPQCVSSCGDLVDACDAMEIAADAAGAASADGYETDDMGGTWTAWAAQPFAADEHIASLCAFEIDADTIRIIAARGSTDGGNPFEIGYSDDDGDTWTNVNVGSTNGEYALHGGALFALDHRHIWVCTDDGNVYFSSDGGLTWEDQGAPAPGASEGLYCIHFVDEKFGMAVGGNPATTGFYIETTDGGEHWSEMDAEPEAVVGTGVRVLDNNRAWVTVENGGLYYTTDWAATWTERTLPIAASALGDIDNIDEYALSVCGTYTSGGSYYPIMYRTIDGGYDWEYHIHDTEFNTGNEYYGMNALIMCSYNQIIVVGEQISGANSAVLFYQPAGW